MLGSPRGSMSRRSSQVWGPKTTSTSSDHSPWAYTRAESPMTRTPNDSSMYKVADASGYASPRQRQSYSPSSNAIHQTQYPSSNNLSNKTSIPSIRSKLKREFKPISSSLYDEDDDEDEISNSNKRQRRIELAFDPSEDQYHDELMQLDDGVEPSLTRGVRGVNKRDRRVHDDDDDDDVDDDNADQLGKRQRKDLAESRLTLQTNKRNKHARSSEEEQEDDDRDDDMLLDKEDVIPRSGTTSKRHKASASSNVNSNDMNRLPHKRGDKRSLKQVDGDDGRFEYDPDFIGSNLRRDQTSKARNADSDFSDDEQNQETRPDETGSTRGHKRSKSISVRSASEEESVMGDDLDMNERLQDENKREDELKTTTPRKRLLKGLTSSNKPTVKHLSRSGMSTPNSRRNRMDERVATSQSKRKIGDEWTNMEGDLCRLDQDGQVRKLVQVREMRRKHKMPADSVHPDAKLMHEVIVERWLTNNEQDELAKQRKLAWQTPFEQDQRRGNANEDDGDINMSDVDVAAGSNSTKKERPSGLYYSTGSGTPLRTHSSLAQRQVSNSSRPNSRQASPAPGTLTPTSGAGSPALVNGRFRIASGASGTQSPGHSTGASMSRSAWSSSRIARLAEDEQRAKAERDKRRKASIMLGGEEDQPILKDSVASGKKVEKDEQTKQDAGKIKLADYGDDGNRLTKSKEASKLDFNSPQPVEAQSDSATTTGTKEQSSTTSKVPDFFSGLNKPSSDVPTGLAPTLASGSSSAPVFSFGKKDASEPVSAVKPTAEPVKPGFSFAPASAGNSTSVPSTLTFGTSSQPVDQSNKDTKPATFSFGGEKTKAHQSSAPASSTPSFSFATTGQSDKKGDEVVKSTFSFGKSTTAATEAASSSTATPAFSFGGPSAPPVAPPAQNNGSASFSFGSTGSTKPTTSSTTTTTPLFAFGADTQSSSNSNASMPVPASTPSFSFGTSNNSNSTPAAPLTGGFMFESQTSNPTTTTGGFSFGNSTSATVPTSATNAGGFNFGAASPQNVVVPGTNSAPNLFSIGAGNESDTSSVGGGRRRTVRRLPSRAS
ncbi:hypothetical protein OIO90_005208 [Microbotryomycetes sp. JL221]|nr:hypothetical protein OIO90_005208 [Microbotryomycetes sp. JL221]